MRDAGALGIRRRFVDVGGRQVHYRRAGAGPAVVMLHISPLSSRMMVPLLERVADRYCLIALDTPGYGDSERLSAVAPSIADYADGVAETLDALGLERPVVYGRATGALIALELAVRHPDRVGSLVLEGLLLLDDVERESMMVSFAPPLDPQWDGTHLVRAWAWWREFNVFWPWFHRDLSTRLAMDSPPLAKLHQDVVDILRAGSGYDLAPRAVFGYEGRPSLARLTVPTTVVGTPHPVSVSWLARLGPLPPSCTVARLELDPAARSGEGDPDGYAAQLGELIGRNASVLAAPAVVGAGSIRGRLGRTFVDLPTGQVLVRCRDDVAGRPLVLLHRFPRSSASLEPLLELMGATGPVIAPDLPGFGGSDRLDDECSVAALAGVVIALLDWLDIHDADLYGVGEGGLVALEVALSEPGRFRLLALEDVPVLTPEQVEELSARYAPPLEPSLGGTHLLAAWNRVRDMSLYWPWYAQARETIEWGPVRDPGSLHQETLELLDSADGLADAYRAAFTYPVGKRLGALAARTLVIARPGAPRFEAFIREAAAAGAPVTSRPLPDDVEETAALLVRFFDGGGDLR